MHSNEYYYSCRGGAYRRHIVQYVSKRLPSGSIAGASTEGEVDATCVQFGSRWERIPPSRGENSLRYMGHDDYCIVSSCH